MRRTGRLPVQMERPVLRYRSGEYKDEVDQVASEYALTIYVNDQEMATVVCTPEYLEDLVVGFLASEGVIRSMDQIKDLQLSTFMGTARVRTTTDVNFNQAFYNKRYIASCCGKSRQSFYFLNDAHTAKWVDDDVSLGAAEIFRLVKEMEEAAAVFHATGGVHTACLADTQHLLLARTDIGRHNALDKLYGYALRQGLTLDGKVVTFSGRLSSEVVLKVAKIGVGIVLAKSAPTALALDIAEELNITTVGFVRGNAFNVYTHPWRIAR
ncbi:MAG: formate dehydrogenase accessory sulfurtransferase FdhD [Alicyclobacillus herbarius]|uniref:formate dehydrogenase accessory sulfurtransferase FdhD n=1 Tax=Alicyclobacillus herbarius TaxID=122960 RepID=UPI002352B5E9|nr:formate dehydrogenase accessory sulfurtransferase FdhD [Alicyclobacillus herbarius]MCL6633257.1 formate dehydrogenase accessory sulfurtransferase FdhD [Alicyclobacillus herbarius]